MDRLCIADVLNVNAYRGVTEYARSSAVTMAYVKKNIRICNLITNFIILVL